MEEADCHWQRDLVDLSICEIRGSKNDTGGYCSGIFTDDITKFDLNVYFLTERQGEMKALINLTNIDACAILEGTIKSAPLIYIVRDILASAGNLPKKCPIQSGYQFKFENINVEAKYFPFLPDVKFQFVLDFVLNKVPSSFIISVTGHIVSYRKSFIRG